MTKDLSPKDNARRHCFCLHALASEASLTASGISPTSWWRVAKRPLLKMSWWAWWVLVWWYVATLEAQLLDIWAILFSIYDPIDNFCPHHCIQLHSTYLVKKSCLNSQPWFWTNQIAKHPSSFGRSPVVLAMALPWPWPSCSLKIRFAARGCGLMWKQQAPQEVPTGSRNMM